MRTHILALACFVPAFATAQTVTSVYNRDTHEPFKLKNVTVNSTVVGPIVRTSTLLTYHNPYTKLTEATLNFEMAQAAALGGFAYFYGGEYVPGQLMDKNKAWFIYTAITSRNRDPGIMEQWSPTTYHCQIFPIKTGHDLKVRLWTVAMLQPDGEKLSVPQPQVPNAVGYEVQDGTVAVPDWTVRNVGKSRAVRDGAGYSEAMTAPISAVSQRFKDGRVYVAGLMRAEGGQGHKIKIERAFYEPSDGRGGGADVTDKVAKLVAEGKVALEASNANFGDPNPGLVKQLRVAYQVDGVEKNQMVVEDTSLNLVTEGEPLTPKFPGLRQPKTVQMDGQTVAFSGWIPQHRKLAATLNGHRVSFRPQRLAPGSEAARLWAQQMLAAGNFRRSKDVLAFSMKYGVPSTATALLAVPKEEMKKFREKEKEFNQKQADQRRRELAAERKRRNWTGNKNQNWNRGGGGDPEIRVVIPGAKSAEALLPDGRVLTLKADGDVWGGNFEIPAQAKEGSYQIRVVAHMPDGSTTERAWTYQVDRTAPKGTVELVSNGNRLLIRVKSESGLNEVAAYSPSGERWLLKEVRPGVYEAEVPRAERYTVVLKDGAGNRGELLCTPAR